jgi:hypothetical protein
MIMAPVPDFIRRELFPGERVIWLGRSRATQVVLYLAATTVAVVAFFVWVLPARDGLSIGLAISVAHTLLVQLGAQYVLTDTRAITINRILPPRCVYIDLIDTSGAPVPIKLGWIDGIRFGWIFPHRQTFRNRLVRGSVTSLSFRALEDHKRVYDWALSAQRAVRASATRTA